MRMEDIRKKYPQYDDIDDGQLLRALHSKHYSDMPYSEFASKVDMSKPEQSGLDKARGAIGSLNKGILMDWGDEIVGAGRALIDKALPNAEYDFGENMAPTEEQSFGDRYEMYRDDERKVQEDFADQNSGLALGLELGGSLLSPVNYVGPGLQAAKTAGALRAGAQIGARGAVEGAVTGAGAAEDDTLTGAIRGGTLGGVLGATLGGGGRALTSRKIDEELISDAALAQAKKIRKTQGKEAADQFLEDSFTPIHMTKDDNILTDTYREGVGRIAGAASKLRNQEKSFVKSAKAAAKAAKTQTKEALDEIADRPAFTESMKAIETEAARAQAKQGVSQAIIDTPTGQKLWDEIDSEKFDPEKVATKLREHWKKHGFKEVKQMSFDVDDELIDILKKHYPEDDVAESVRKKMSGKALMDLRNEFRIAANKPTPSMKGKEAREFADEIDVWMKSRMEGGKDGALAQRFQDELDTWGEYQAYRRGLRRQDAGRFNINQLAAGRGVKGEEGIDFGQQAARKAKEAMDAEKLATKQANRADTEQAKAGLALARDKLSEVKGRRAPKASGLSELFTTRWAGALADRAFRGAALPAGLGVGQVIGSIPGQRFAAGQTNFQKLLQEDEMAKLIAQLLRQTTVREISGE